MRVYLPNDVRPLGPGGGCRQIASRMIFYFTSRVIVTRVWSTKFLES